VSLRTRVLTVALLAAVVAVASALAGGCASAARSSPHGHALTHPRPRHLDTRPLTAAKNRRT
jgi:hypothetical protein